MNCYAYLLWLLSNVRVFVCLCLRLIMKDDPKCVGWFETGTTKSLICVSQGQLHAFFLNAPMWGAFVLLILMICLSTKSIQIASPDPWYQSHTIGRVCLFILFSTLFIKSHFMHAIWLIASYVSEQTNYHHGEASLHQTITHMAQVSTIHTHIVALRTISSWFLFSLCATQSFITLNLSCVPVFVFAVCASGCDVVEFCGWK